MSFAGGASSFGAPDVEEGKSMMGRASDFARGLAHPVPAFFHIVFKGLAIGVYMFGSLFSSSFVNIFIVCILLLAFDFWTVKNVTGRLMVGLRWNSVVEEDGSTSWRFEAQEEGLSSTSLDIAVFWVGLFTPGVVWVLFGLGCFFSFKFDWLLLITAAMALSWANIIGYVRCKQDVRSRIGAGVAGLVARTGMNASMAGAVQSAAGSAFGFS